MSEIALKWAYERPTPEDGLRVLVDRLWPRGLKRSEARIDLWLKDVAPSTELRRWFGHDPRKWDEFQDRYRAELSVSSALEELRSLAKGNKRLTLVFGATDRHHLPGPGQPALHGVVVPDVLRQGA